MHPHPEWATSCKGRIFSLGTFSIPKLWKLSQKESEL